MSDSDTGGRVRRIHFTSGWKEPDDIAGYRCRKCGAQRLTAEGCYEHRKGLVSECLRYRLRDRLGRLLSTDR